MKTVDQARKERGDAPLPNGLGEVILNPVWLQWAQAKLAQQQGPNSSLPPGSPDVDADPIEQQQEPDASQSQVDQQGASADDEAQKSLGRSLSFEVSL